MNKALLEVVRLNNEDVIATSINDCNDIIDGSISIGSYKATSGKELELGLSAYQGQNYVNGNKVGNNNGENVFTIDKYYHYVESSKIEDDVYSEWVICDGDEECTDNCLALGTKVTMADNSLKNVEDIKLGDKLMSYNHETGEYEPQEVFIAYKSEKPKKYFTLHFTNDIEISIIGGHDLFEKESNKYVTVSEDNAKSFVGKHFYNATCKQYEELLSVTYSDEPVDYYCLYTKYNMNSIANNMLNAPDDVDMYLNIYEFGKDLIADKDALNRDIES